MVTLFARYVIKRRVFRVLNFPELSASVPSSRACDIYILRLTGGLMHFISERSLFSIFHACVETYPSANFCKYTDGGILGACR